MGSRFIVGVDEAGRGPLAGPLAVGVIVAPAEMDLMEIFPGLNDSKQLSEKKREELFSILKESVDVGIIRYTVIFVSHEIIDKIGLTKATKRAVFKGVRTLLPHATEGKVFLDGLLHAPPQYKQETVIHGDSLIPAIMLASVAAKVMRDRTMVRVAKKYPSYGFEEHKGYGTPAHIERLREFGTCPVHRMTFLSNILGASIPA